jgi:hypothetical protein
MMIENFQNEGVVIGHLTPLIAIKWLVSQILHEVNVLLGCQNVLHCYEKMCVR